MKDCIFCKIARKEAPATYHYEDDEIVAFDAIPKIAPIHILIIPKEHIESVNELTEDKKGEKIAGRLILVAKKIAREKGINEDGYKLLIRTGEHGGQEVPHLHLHLLGGARLSEGIKPI